jgi:hypothetical protein
MHRLQRGGPCLLIGSHIEALPQASHVGFAAQVDRIAPHGPAGALELDEMAPPDDFAVHHRLNGPAVRLQLPPRIVREVLQVTQPMVRALVQIEVHPLGIRERPVGPGIPDDDRPAMLVGRQTGVRHRVVLDPGHEPILSVAAALER